MKVQVIWPPIVTFWPKGKKKLRYNKKKNCTFYDFLDFWGDFEQVLYLTFFDSRLRFFVIGL